MKILINSLIFFRHFGWKGIYSLFLKVSWKQDTESKNGGYDLTKLRDSNYGYFFGTYWERNKFISYSSRS